MTAHPPKLKGLFHIPYRLQSKRSPGKIALEFGHSQLVRIEQRTVRIGKTRLMARATNSAWTPQPIIPRLWLSGHAW